MNMMILAGLPREFDVLAMQAALGGDIGARLEALVQQTREAAGTDAGWQREVQKIRAKLRGQKIALDASNPALPDKLADPDNQRRRAFYATAITHLTALIEAE
jgi:uncharacterized protein involved in exopolysaccharide biosynthesis